MTTISRRSTITALIAGVPTAAAVAGSEDPALKLVKRYRAGMAAFSKSPECDDNDEEARLVAATYGGPWDEITTRFPLPVTKQGAIETARLLVEEQSSFFACDGQRNMAEALLAYLERL